MNGNSGDRRKRNTIFKPWWIVAISGRVDVRDPYRTLPDTRHTPRRPHFYGRLVGVDAINGAADEIRQNFFGYRNFVVGEIQEMQNVALCRWGSGIPGEAFKYSGTDLLEERDGPMTIFYTFIDGHSPMSFSTE